MGPFREELPQPIQRLRDRVRPCDADDVKAAPGSRARKRGLERRAIV